MTDISDLERRLSSALEKIGRGLDGLNASSSGPDPEEMAELQNALQSERATRAELEARLGKIGDLESQMTQLQSEITKLRDELARRHGDTQRLKRVNAQLRANNLTLRDANARGVGDADLINTAMMAELEALRVSHDADRSELDAILTDLKPLLTQDQ